MARIAQKSGFLADEVGLLLEPELAKHKMIALLTTYGIDTG